MLEVITGSVGHRLETFEEAVEDFQDSSQEWRRLFSELLGTFFLVLVAAGGGMMGQAFPGTISRTAAVVAPGLMVIAIILFMGKVSGAHLNPAVSVAFALRGRLPVVARPRVRDRSARRRRARRVVPPGRGPRVRDVRLELPGRGVLERRRVLDGAGAHVRARQRDPRHRVGCAEPRRDRRVRRRRLHRARRPLGQPDLGRVDEPGPHVRSRRRRRRLPRLLGLRGGSSRGGSARGRARHTSSGVAVVAEPAVAPPRAPFEKRSLGPSKPDAVAPRPTSFASVAGDVRPDRRVRWMHLLRPRREHSDVHDDARRAPRAQAAATRRQSPQRTGSRQATFR